MLIHSAIPDLRATLKTRGRIVFVPTMGNLHAGHISLMEQARAHGDTVRADDGLALSSRNGYLSATERAEAPRLYRLLNNIRDAVRSGGNDYAALENGAISELTAAGWKTDYVAIRQQSDLSPASGGNAPLVVLGASRLGTTRLIDNIEI